MSYLCYIVFFLFSFLLSLESFKFATYKMPWKPKLGILWPELTSIVALEIIKEHPSSQKTKMTGGYLLSFGDAMGSQPSHGDS